MLAPSKHEDNTFLWKTEFCLSECRVLIFQKVATVIFLILNKCVILNLHPTKFLHQNSVTISCINKIATLGFSLRALSGEYVRPSIRPLPIISEYIVC